MRPWIPLVLALVACSATPTQPGPRPDAAAPISAAREAQQQRPLIIALGAEPASLEYNLSAGSNNSDFSALANAYLIYHDPPQIPRPYLAAEVPTIADGSWKVLPDGRMEVTYRLKRNARWHDGRPVTAHDMVFAYRVRTEGILPVQSADSEKKIGSAVAADDHTLFLTFAVPYLWAGRIHGPDFAPLPKELLEPLYGSDREAFVNGPHWREQYVGSGPYRLDRWEPGVEIVFRAHDGFVMGKPKIDRVTVRFILDANVIVANIRSGAIDMSYYVAVAFPQGQALEESGWEGAVSYWRGAPRFLEFQQRDWGNLQRAVLDVRVRRALLHAIDRRAIVDSLYAGKTVSPHMWLAPDDPAYPAADRAVDKYEYDPARAEALLREASWTRAADGLARGPTGDMLTMPMLNLAGPVEQQEAAVVANFWKALGVPAEVHILNQQQNRDGEFRSKFPGVSYGRRGIGYEMMGWTTEHLAVPEGRWAGGNRGGYLNPALEEVWKKVLATVDDAERERYIVEGLKLMTADAVVTPTHLQPRTVLIPKGLAGPKESWVQERAIVWNIWEWQWS